MPDDAIVDRMRTDLAAHARDIAVLQTEAAALKEGTARLEGDVGRLRNTLDALRTETANGLREVRDAIAALHEQMLTAYTPQAAERLAQSERQRGLLWGSLAGALGVIATFLTTLVSGLWSHIWSAHP